MNITVYGRQGCIQCRYTTKQLAKLGLAYEYIDITEDRQAEEYVRELVCRQFAIETTGSVSIEMPLVIVKHGTHTDVWSGFRIAKIKGLVGDV